MTICTPWRVADSLNRLLGQIDARAPKRSKASDGSIGDLAHQAEACASEHNSCCTRYLGIWIVRARDFTHDPAHGADMNQWAEALRASRDRRIRYLIWNRRITGPNHRNALGQWIWDPYSGDSPHTEHMHVSTFNDAARFDSTAPWAEPGVQKEESDPMADTWTQPLTQGTKGYAGQQRDTALAFTWQAASEASAGVGRLEAAAAADEQRDSAALAAIQALAAGGGVDAAPIVAAVREVGAETHAAVTALQGQVAALAEENRALRERLAKALAPEQEG